MMTVQSVRRLDELVIEALAVQQPAARTSDSYLAMEVVADDADDDVAVTHQFVRASMPYERIELGSASSSTRIPRARRTTFVKTVRVMPPAPAATLSFDKVWFEQSDDVIAATDDNTPLARANSWLWLGISLLAGAFAVGIVRYVL